MKKCCDCQFVGEIKSPESDAFQVVCLSDDTRTVDPDFLFGNDIYTNISCQQARESPSLCSKHAVYFKPKKGLTSGSALT